MSFANDVIDLIGVFGISFALMIGGQSAVNFVKNPRVPGFALELREIFGLARKAILKK